MNWVEYFERNRQNRTRIPWEQGINLDPAVRDPLVRSLQRFQVAESGDGVHIRRGAAATGDASYACAVDMFMNEEGVHSALLDRVLTLLGAPLLHGHWSDACFVVARRLMGLRVELMVILIAEMIAKRYYQILHDRIGDPVLHTVFSQLVHDETGHLEFHCEYLRGVLERAPRFLHPAVRGGLRAFYQLAFLTVVFDHRELLRALNVSPGEFLRGCDELFEEIAGKLFGGRGVGIPISSEA